MCRLQAHWRLRSRKAASERFVQDTFIDVNSQGSKIVGITRTITHHHCFHTAHCLCLILSLSTYFLFKKCFISQKFIHLNYFHIFHASFEARH